MTETRPKTPYGVHCLGWDFDDPKSSCSSGKIIYLTFEEYKRQLDRPDSTWRCPYCKCEAYWDDDNYEEEKDTV